MNPPETLVDHLRRRPALYLGTKSLTALFHHHEGYRWACTKHRIDDDAFDLKIPYDFNDWVAYRTRYGSGSARWLSMILESCRSDEDAFDRFFELLDEYTRRTPLLIAEIIAPLTSTCGYTDRHGVPIPEPAKVQIVKYNDHDPGFFALLGFSNHRDHFYPVLSSMRDITGGEWIIHDQHLHHQLLREQVASDLKTGRDREIWARIRHPDPAYHQQLSRDLAREQHPNSPHAP